MSLNSLPNFLLHRWLKRLYFRVFTQFWKWCTNVNSSDFENTLSLKASRILHITQYFKYIFMLCGSYLGVENYHIRFVVYLEFWKEIIMKQKEITSKLRKNFFPFLFHRVGSHLYFRTYLLSLLNFEILTKSIIYHFAIFYQR